MTPALLHAVARKAEALTSDADLLTRYIRDRDHHAFEELVRRHGPLVWAVCRHLLPHHADAEDAFQAVFLSLVRCAARIRDGRTIPAWLHGVAVRIAARARREFARRRARERTAALPEVDQPVPDVAWETLVAAVHEEVQLLPDAERTAFVLCDMQGVSQPDAATRLGWPLGSVSGRLCKARQRLLDRLTARGVAPMAVVGIGITAGAASAVPSGVPGGTPRGFPLRPPPALFDAVKSFPGAPAAASQAATALARGLTEGISMRMRLTTAAAVMVAALGVTGGAVVLSKADAQPPAGGGGGIGAPPGTGAPPPAGMGGGPPGVGGIGAPPPGVGGGAGAPPMGGGGNPWGGAAGGPGMGGFGGGWASSSPNVEHKFVDVKNDRKAFETAIVQQGKEGWEFCGSERFAQGELTLVFKKAKGGIVNNFGGGGMVVPGMPGGMGGGPGGAGAGQNLFEVFPLKNSVATEVVAALQKAFPNANIKAVAEKGANAVIIISAEKGALKDIAKWIGEMDAGPKPKPGPGGGLGMPPGPGTGPMGGGFNPLPIGPIGGGGGWKPATGINVFNLKFAKADEMVTVLKKLFPNADMTSDPRTNTVIVRADDKTLDELKAILARLDVEVDNTKPKK